MIGIVAKDIITETIKRLAKLNKEDSLCIWRCNESIAAQIERFDLPAQYYFNLTSTDRPFAVSRSLKMILISKWQPFPKIVLTYLDQRGFQ